MWSMLKSRRLVDYCRRLSQTANSAEHREPIGAVGCPRRVRPECRSVRHSFIISIILFNLLLCLLCMRFCSACSLLCRICSGIHFPAVLRVISNSRAQADTLPPGCSLNHISTRACCVGAPFRLILGSFSVNRAIISPPFSSVYLIC